MSLHPRIVWLPLAALAASAPAQATVYLSIEQAQQAMFGSTPLTARTFVLDAAQIAAVQKDAGLPVMSPTVRVWQAADGGWFFVDAVIGKSELITYALALNADGRVRQIEILEYREAHGEEVRYPRWRKQFTNKQHGDPVMLGTDIQNISGATLSCQHVTDGVRRLLAIHAVALKPAQT